MAVRWATEQSTLRETAVERSPEQAGARWLRRGLWTVPSLFTGARVACGYFAVVFDSLDGRIARLIGSTSSFGLHFDSMADVVTFGMAPAFLASYWGVTHVPQVVAGTQLAHALRPAGWAVPCAYVVCAAVRLARFNISAVMSESGPRRFVGLPTPGGAAVIASIVHFAKRPVDDWRYGLAWLVLVAVLGLLMISRVRYETPALPVYMRRPLVSWTLGALLVWALWAHSEQVLLILALTYAVSGPLARVVSRPHPPALPQAERAAGRAAPPVCGPTGPTTNPRASR